MTVGGVLLAAIVGGALLLLGGGEREQPAPALVTPVPGLRLGVVANALDDDMLRVARGVRGLGVTWMREEFRWSQMEPERGRFDFALQDQLMERLAGQGIRVLPLLFKTPSWAGSNPVQLRPVLPDWQEYVRRVTARYAPGGSFWRARPQLDAALAPTVWEVWNEPWFEQFSFPGPDAARYAALVKATVVAGRSTSPSLRFLTALETSYVATDGSRRNWTRDVLRAVPDLGKYLDAVTVHPYSSGGPGDTGLPRAQQFRRFEDVEADLVDLGVGRRPLWVTELGWPTCSARPPCVEEGRQARYLAEALNRLGRHREVEAAFVYSFHDLRGRSDDPQAHFGVVDEADRPKAAYDVVGEAASRG